MPKMLMKAESLNTRGMRIASIDCIPVEMEVKPRSEKEGLAPYNSSNRGRKIDISDQYEVETRKRMLIRLETKEGITGWGEMLITLKSVEATTAMLRNVVFPKLKGKSISDIESFIDSIYYPYMKISPLLGGVEMAMLDALGKHLETPLYDLLGGKHTGTVPLAYCVGILDPEQSRDHAQRAVEMGFEVLKTKGGRDWRVDVKRIQAMHNEVGDALDFRLDPNQAYSPEDAVRFASTLEDHGIYLQYLEQPVRIERFGNMKRLRQRVRTPIAANEDAYFEGNVHHLIKEDAIDVAVVDLIPSGGIHAVRKTAAMCAQASVSVAHHSGFDLGIKTAAVLHTFASTPGLNLAPDTIYYSWKDDILESRLKLENGTMKVPDGPGLGVDVDEERIEKYRM